MVWRWFSQFVHVTEEAWADTEGLPIEAATSTDPGLDLLPSVVLILLALLLLVWIIAGLSRGPFTLFGRPTVRHLFLEIQFRLAGERGSDSVSWGKSVGHLRELSLEAVTFVSPRSCPKGHKIEFFLDSLPDFPQSGSIVTAIVTNVRQLGGDPPSYLMDAKILQMDGATRIPLMDYLVRLAHPGRFKGI